MPVSEQNRNQSTSLAIPDNHHEFTNGPDGPEDDDDKHFTIG